MSNKILELRKLAHQACDLANELNLLRLRSNNKYFDRLYKKSQNRADRRLDAWDKAMDNICYNGNHPVSENGVCLVDGGYKY